MNLWQVWKFGYFEGEKCGVDPWKAFFIVFEGPSFAGKKRRGQYSNKKYKNCNNLVTKIICNHVMQCSYHKWYWKLPFKIFKCCIQFITCCLYVICMSLVCHSYERVYHSYVILISLVCARFWSVSHSHVLVYHPYVTRMYSYVTRMSLVCTRMSSACHSSVVVPWTWTEISGSSLCSAYLLNCVVLSYGIILRSVYQYLECYSDKILDSNCRNPTSRPVGGRSLTISFPVFGHRFGKTGITVLQLNSSYSNSCK